MQFAEPKDAVWPILNEIWKSKMEIPELAVMTIAARLPALLSAIESRDRVRKSAVVDYYGPQERTPEWAK